MKNERIQLKMVNGRSGAIILKKQYDLLSAFIIKTIQTQHNREITLVELLDKAQQKFGHTFEGELAWCLISIKQDLQAKGLLQISHVKKRVQIVALKENSEKTARLLSITGKYLVTNQEPSTVVV